MISTFFSSNTSAGLDLHTYSDLASPHVTFTASDSIGEAGTLRVGRIVVRNEPEITRENPYVVTVRGTALSEDNYRKDATFLIFTTDSDLPGVPQLPDPDNDTNERDNEPDFKVYPNPFQTVLHVEWPSSRAFTLILHNAIGQAIFQGRETSPAVFKVIPCLPECTFTGSATDARSQGASWSNINSVQIALSIGNCFPENAFLLVHSIAGPLQNSSSEGKPSGRNATVHKYRLPVEM